MMLIGSQMMNAIRARHVHTAFLFGAAGIIVDGVVRCFVAAACQR